MGIFDKTSSETSRSTSDQRSSQSQSGEDRRTQSSFTETQVGEAGFLEKSLNAMVMSLLGGVQNFEAPTEIDPQTLKQIEVLQRLGLQRTKETIGQGLEDTLEMVNLSAANTGQVGSSNTSYTRALAGRDANRQLGQAALQSQEFGAQAGLSSLQAQKSRALQLLGIQVGAAGTAQSAASNLRNFRVNIARKVMGGSSEGSQSGYSSGTSHTSGYGTTNRKTTDVAGGIAGIAGGFGSWFPSGGGGGGGGGGGQV